MKKNSTDENDKPFIVCYIYKWKSMIKPTESMQNYVK